MFVPDEDMAGRLVDARLDQLDKDSKAANLGDFGRPELYHIAVRVKPDWSPKPVQKGVQP